MSNTNRLVTIAYGDGIGPEIMQATLRILQAAQAPLQFEEIEIGQKVYERGVSAGIEDSAWDSLRRSKVFLKSPITTPQGGGYKSMNVTTRKTLGLFANVRPVVTLNPFVHSYHNMDLVIIRENEEDLYAGIEHQQTPEVVQCLKLLSVPGTERIVRYAFEYAVAYNRKKVTCFSKDNIMKLTDGMFHRVFDEIAKEYPQIETDHRIIDIGSAQIAERPHIFDVIVTLNLYGDIISDIAAQVAGSVGLCGSANVGQEVAMFEAIHGSAPDIAGQDKANPSGLLNGAIMMLVHMQLPSVASTIHNAWLKTLEDGIHTGDIYKDGSSKKLVGTQAFADAVIERLGQLPTHFKVVNYGADGAAAIKLQAPKRPTAVKETVGVDVFLQWNGGSPDQLGQLLESLATPATQLQMISNRGVKVYPQGHAETFCTDHWRCRFMARQGSLSHQDILDLLSAVAAHGLDFIKTENLCTFDGVKGFSLGQGQ